MTRALPGEETLVANWSALAVGSAGARVLRDHDVIVAVFPAWAPLNNAILVGEPVERTPTATVDRLAARYAAADVDTWALWVRSPHPSFTASDHVALPTLRRDTTTLVMTADLDRRFVRSNDVVACALDDALTAGDDPVRADELRPSVDDVPGLRAWVAIEDGWAVAGLWTFAHDDDCGVYGVGTVPAARRRGHARRLVTHALADARERGTRTASLQSTEVAESLYHALGFRAVGRYEEWVHEPTDSV